MLLAVVVCLVAASAAPAQNNTVRITRVELVQTIQDIQNTVPLVSEKPTAVRVFVEQTGGATPAPQVSATLSAVRRGAPLAGQPTRLNFTISPRTQADRRRADDSLNFRLPLSWTEIPGEPVTIEARVEAAPGAAPVRVDNSPVSVTVRFVRTWDRWKPLRIAYLPVCVPVVETGTTMCGGQGGSLAGELSFLAEKLFPVGEGGLSIVPLPAPGLVWDDSDAGWVEQMGRKAWEVWSGLLPDLDALLVLLPPLAPWTGELPERPLGEHSRVFVLRDLSGTGFDPDGLATAATLAQHAGRLLGLSAPISGCPPERIQEIGFDPLDNRVMDDARSSFLTQCDPRQRWIGVDDYRTLYDQLSRWRRSGPAGDEAAAWLSGWITSEGSEGSLDPVFPAPGSGSLSASTGGETCVEFWSETEKTASHCFGFPPAAEPMARRYFLFRLRLPAGTRKLLLTTGGRQVAERLAGSPVEGLAIDGPRPGELWQGVRTLQWSAAQGDGITFRVDYSANGVAEWRPLAFDLGRRQFDLDTTPVEGGARVWFRVTGSSGLDWSSATAGPIEIRQAPRLEASPGSIRFDQLRPGEAAVKWVDLRNTGTGPVSIHSLSVDSPAFRLRSPALPFSVTPGARRRVAVEYVPENPGRTSASIRISSSDAFQPVSSVAAEGLAVDPTPPPAPQFWLTPGALDFASVEAGKTKDLTLTIVNSGDASGRISSIVSTNPRYSITGAALPMTLNSAGRSTVTVRFAPIAQGNQAGELLIAADGSTGALVARLFGTGTAVVVTPPPVPPPTPTPPPPPPPGPASNPVPAIASLTPASMIAGSPDSTLTVRGTGFVPDSAVELNLTRRATTFVSSTELRALVPATELTSPSSLNVTVWSPAPGGGRSAPVLFHIEIPPPPAPPGPGAGPLVLINQIEQPFCPEVNAFVTVFDRDLNYMDRLTAASLSCTEDGQPARCSVEVAGEAGKPLSVALVLASSKLGNIGGEIELVKQGARSFVDLLFPTDRVAVIQVENQANFLQTFTDNRAQLAGVIDRMRDGGQEAALFDGIDAALRTISAEKGRRWAIIVVAGSENTMGRIRDAAPVTQLAKSLGVPIFGVATGLGAANPRVQDLLRQLAADTHALSFHDEIHLVGRRLQKLAEALSGQYLLNYFSGKSDGQPHNLRVTLGGLRGNGWDARNYTACRPF